MTSEELIDPSQESPAPAKKKRTGLKAFIAIVVVLVLAVAGCCAALVYDDGQRTKVVPANTTLDGAEDISGMTYKEVETVAREHFDDGKTPSISVSLNGKFYKLSYSDLGTCDAEATAKEAVSNAYGDTLIERCVERVQEIVQGKRPEARRLFTKCAIDEDAVKAAVKKLSKKVNVKGKDAYYTYSKKKNGLVTHAATNGMKVDKTATAESIIAALDTVTSSSVIVTGTCTASEASESKAGKAIYVDTNKCVLRLYNNGKVVFKCACTPGKTGYETPTGDFTITNKDSSPSWYNPNKEWSANMAQVIGPGEDNPLGLRAMALSCGGGIYIHGTVLLSELGSPGSHGCVRLANANVVKLFDMVKVGTPVFIR